MRLWHSMWYNIMSVFLIYDNTNTNTITTLFLYLHQESSPSLPRRVEAEAGRAAVACKTWLLLYAWLNLCFGWHEILAHQHKKENYLWSVTTTSWRYKCLGLINCWILIICGGWSVVQNKYTWQQNFFCCFIFDINEK